MRIKAEDSKIGRVASIATRPIKKAPPERVRVAKLNVSDGLQGDHYSGKSGNRQLTLISEQELSETAKLLGKEQIDPLLTRRNLVYSGRPISEKESRLIGIGESLAIRITGPCHPCKQMDENFGPGGEEAMKGRAGLTAKVLKDGTIKAGDQLFFIEE